MDLVATDMVDMKVLGEARCYTHPVLLGEAQQAMAMEVTVAEEEGEALEKIKRGGKPRDS